ncbi:MAG: bifunctional glycosyltransferase family 2/GtrA family protein [Oscillospiraceae bacterium]|nr:bifunctional glycosyltransferase family 2/GtrA family protein [Oscillospiraceae bacterium]
MAEKWIMLIPAYQPDGQLVDLLCEAQQAQFEAVVVDDGSKEPFATLFQQAGAYSTVLAHPENQGKGRALKTGFAYIQEKYGEDCIIVTMDADGQHRVEDAKKLCQAAQARPDTLVLGSRGLKEHTPIRSRFGNAVTRWVYRLSTGVRVHDTQTGLRAFSGRLLGEMAQIPGERYEYEMNVLLECARRRIPIREEEIATIYIDHNAGSHFDTLKDSYRVYKEILKFSASSFAGFLVDYAVYSLLLLLTAGWGAATSLRLSNICARIVSASVNYTINRKLVFKSKTGLLRSAIQYFALAAVILLGNTAVLSLFVENLGFNRFLAKIGTEILFFLFNWLIQRYIIFKRRDHIDDGNEKTR